MTPAEIYAAIHFAVSVVQMPAGAVHPDQLRTVNDLALEIVHCYRPTANFTTVRTVEAPWSHGKEWKADGSAVIAISYTGNVTRLRHVLQVAVMFRGKQFMALPLADKGNPVPWAKDCSLRNWASAKE